MNILEQLQGQAEQIEVLELHSEVTTIRFESNVLKTSQVEETSGLAVRVVKAGRLGFAASSDATATEKLIANVLESAAYGDETPLVFPGALPAPAVPCYDARIPELPIARLVEIGQEIVAYLREVDPEGLVDVDLRRAVQQTALRNQAGAEIAVTRSPFSIDFGVNRVKDDDVLILYDALGTTLWDEDYMPPVRRMGKHLRLAQTIVPARSGRMPVIFSPFGGLMLTYPLMVALNGKQVVKGISPLAGRIGEQIFDAKLTFVDDATLPGRYNSAPYDDEGVPHRRNVLVEAGVLRGFLYDLKTAAQAGVESTGNGERGLFSLPSPSGSTMCLSAGKTPLAEMLAGIKEGLWVESMLGLGQGNIISGAFSNPLAVAYRIENGQILGRVKDVSLAGNIYDVLRQVAAVSQETEWVYRFLNQPYLLLEDMNVVAKG